MELNLQGQSSLSSVVNVNHIAVYFIVAGTDLNKNEMHELTCEIWVRKLTDEHSTLCMINTYYMNWI